MSVLRSASLAVRREGGVTVAVSPRPAAGTHGCVASGPSDDVAACASHPDSDRRSRRSTWSAEDLSIIGSRTITAGPEFHRPQCTRAILLVAFYARRGGTARPPCEDAWHRESRGAGSARSTRSA